MASSFSSSSSKSETRVYDVFLSFRGGDTRYNFTDHLYTALNGAGIRTFRDSEGLRKGEDISTDLIRAIQGSRMSVIVFSENYAFSRWCLREVEQIMECWETKGQMVIPIFYHMDPSHVRRQIGTFAKAFLGHEASRHVVDLDTISRWRRALPKAANLSGWHIKTDQSEAEVVTYVVDHISGRLNNTYLHVAVKLVGMDSRVQDITNYLGVGQDDDVRLVGIWGMGGSGKTSLAKAIYNKFYRSFEGKSFLANVRETANKSNGMINLQQRLLSDILRPTKVEVGDADRGIIAIQQRLKSKKVLLIVDDVDEVDQLNGLAIRHDSFGPGSRIIITTRDRHLLEILKVDTIHLTRQMKEEEALELFSWHAFHNPCPDAEFLELSISVCTYCGGLPLALEVLGSFLFQRSVRQWKSTLDKLEKYPNDKIQKILRISFDALDMNQKTIFLHISCFFIGMDKNYVTKILEGCGLFAEIDISVLIQRSLVIVSEKNKVMMHDLLRDMGREVVREESSNGPEERSRLWYREDVIDVLTEESGTKKVEGLALNFQRSDKKSFRTNAFTKMQKLKLLRLNYVKLTGNYDHLSKKISWLCWHGFSLKFIGNDFLYQGNLVSMDLRYSNLVQVWDQARLLEKLKILNLSHSHYLTQSPDLSKLPNLEYFIMKDCKSLSEIDPSIGDVKRLALVNFKDCKMLKDLPRSFYKLKCIKALVLSGCSRFENLVEDIGDMISLTTLAVSGTAISQVPSYMGRLKNLNFSSVQGPVRLKLRFPEVPKNYFPAQDFASLAYVNMESISVHNLPELSGLSHLERSCFNNCTNLSHLGSGCRVKKTGISQVWDPKLVNENTIEFEPIPYEYLTSDAGKEAGPSLVSSDEDRPLKRSRSVRQEQSLSLQNTNSTETQGHKQNPKSSQRLCLPSKGMNCKWRWWFSRGGLHMPEKVKRNWFIPTSSPQSYKQGSLQTPFTKQDYEDASIEVQNQIAKGISLNELRGSFSTSSTKRVVDNREQLRSGMTYSYKQKRNVDWWLQNHTTGPAKTTMPNSALMDLADKSMGRDDVVSRRSCHVGNYEVVVLSKMVRGEHHILVATNMRGATVLYWGISKLSPGDLQDAV